MDISILSYNIHGLPWSRNDAEAITHWAPTTSAEILCFQEVFTSRARREIMKILATYGYATIIPRDDGVAWLPSGLLFAYKTSIFSAISDCFCPYFALNDVEWAANKGFHIVRLEHRATRRRLAVINTHTISDNELGWIFGRDYISGLRKKQFNQIVEFMSGVKYPVLIAGDMNCEVSPHPHLRFLHPVTGNLVRKSTFFATGEDLDHFGWLPLQWAPPGCSFCDVVRRGPQLVVCKVFQKTWSDHAPVFATIRVPTEMPSSK